MVWEVFRQSADTWCAVEFVNEHVYARASKHRSEEAAKQAVARLNCSLVPDVKPSSSPIGDSVTNSLKESL